MTELKMTSRDIAIKHKQILASDLMEGIPANDAYDYAAGVLAISLFNFHSTEKTLDETYKIVNDVLGTNAKPY